jgi:hypothetical protein
MRSAILIALAAAVAVPVGAATPQHHRDGEAELQKLLEGRIAGQAERCVSLRQLGSSRVIDGTAIVYRAGGSRIYVNRPDNGASSLREDDIMVTRTSSGQLCNVDTVTMVDRQTQGFTGVVFLGDFIPYDRVRAPK